MNECDEKSSPIGDAARMSEALKEARRVLRKIYKPELSPLDGDNRLITATVGIINAALSAPPRNCDKFKTSWDVLKEWHEGLDTANDIVRLLDWLLAPATEKEGGAS